MSPLERSQAEKQALARTKDPSKKVWLQSLNGQPLTSRYLLLYTPREEQNLILRSRILGPALAGTEPLAWPL